MKRAILLALALAPVAASGCSSDSITEVVLVLTSDLAVPTEADSIQVVVDFDGSASGSVVASEQQSGLVMLGNNFPVSVGFVSSGETPGFSVAIEIDRSFTSVPQIVVRRRITGITFVKGELRMLVVPFSKACACQGTACPNPGNPACDDIENPDTEPFDPTRAPPSGSPTPSIVLGGADAGVRPPPVDAGRGPFGVDAGARDAITTVDVGPPDGALDGGVNDGAVPDGNATDARGLDGNGADGGAGEGGAPEAGVTDGGVG